MTVSRPCKSEEDEEDEVEEEVELSMPGSFDFGGHGGGAARETPGAGSMCSMLSVCLGTCSGAGNKWPITKASKALQNARSVLYSFIFEPIVAAGESKDNPFVQPWRKTGP